MMSATLFTVTELTRAIRDAIEPRFSQIEVRGEVTNPKQQASGHFYFTLKDDRARIGAVIFRGNARHLSHFPKGGDRVIAQGELSIYPPHGNYQIIVRTLQYERGVGHLLLKLHENKTLFEKRGWFDPKCKKSLPLYPKGIGVVTSATGSVIQDILHVLKRRYPPFHLILYPVRVQGEGAAREIAEGIATLNRHHLVEVIIVGRGGGSLEDLWAFNEEEVVRAIFHSNIPIIAAIGHETDLTLADCTADVRAPTPSAAAEICVKELASQTEFLVKSGERITIHLKNTIGKGRARLRAIGHHPLLTSPYRLLSKQLQKIDEIEEAIGRKVRENLAEKSVKLQLIGKQLPTLTPSNRMRALREKLHFFSKRLEAVWIYGQKGREATLRTLTSTLDMAQKEILKRKRECTRPFTRADLLLSPIRKKISTHKGRLDQLISHLTSIDPKNLLKKGYCIPFAEKGDAIIMGVRQLQRGRKLSLFFQDGRASATVEEVEKKGYG